MFSAIGSRVYQDHSSPVSGSPTASPSAIHCSQKSFGQVPTRSLTAHSPSARTFLRLALALPALLPSYSSLALASLQLPRVSAKFPSLRARQNLSHRWSRPWLLFGSLSAIQHCSIEFKRTIPFSFYNVPIVETNHH